MNCAFVLVLMVCGGVFVIVVPIHVVALLFSVNVVYLKKKKYKKFISKKQGNLQVFFCDPAAVLSEKKPPHNAFASGRGW